MPIRRIFTVAVVVRRSNQQPLETSIRNAVKQVDGVEEVEVFETEVEMPVQQQWAENGHKPNTPVDIDN